MSRPKLQQDARLGDTERYNADLERLEKVEAATKAALAEWRRLNDISIKAERAFDAKWNPDFQRKPKPRSICGRNG